MIKNTLACIFSILMTSICNTHQYGTIIFMSQLNYSENLPTQNFRAAKLL